jgi:hypothetical protein
MDNGVQITTESHHSIYATSSNSKGNEKHDHHDSAHIAFIARPETGSSNFTAWETLAKLILRNALEYRHTRGQLSTYQLAQATAAIDQLASDNVSMD